MKFEIDTQSVRTIYSAASESAWDTLDIHAQGWIAGTLSRIVLKTRDTDWQSDEELLNYLATEYRIEQGARGEHHQWTAQDVFAIAGVLELETRFMQILTTKETEKNTSIPSNSKRRWRDLRLDEKLENGIRQIGD